MDEGTAALGIDFGTSHTVAALRHGSGRVEPLLFDASPLLPSAVYADPGGRLLTGADATRGGRLDPAGVEPNPKRRIDDGVLLLGDHEVPVVDAVAAVLGRVAGEAARALGRPADRTVLTHPAEWAAPRCAVLRTAAERAGLGQVALTPEPVAAAAYFTGQLGRVVEPGTALVVYDLGAGTFDVSVLTRTDGDGWRVRASDGLDDVGGLDIDATIVDWLGRGPGLSDPSAWHRLTHPATAQDHRRHRQLWDEARTAKEQLGRGSQATLSLPGTGGDVHLTREEFDTLARPLLERTVRLTRRTMDASGVGPDRMAGVFLVGGSSRIPQVATLLHRSLGFAPTVLEQPELVVAYGSLTDAVTAGPAVAAGPAEPARVAEPGATTAQPVTSTAEPAVAVAQPVAYAAEPTAAVAQPAAAVAVPAQPTDAVRGRATVPVAPPPAAPPADTAPEPPPAPPHLRRVARVLAGLGALALVVALATVPQSRTALLAGARLPVAPGAVIPFLAGMLLLASTGTPAQRSPLRRIAGLAVLTAAGAVLPSTAVALTARLSGHRFKPMFAPATAPVMPYIRLTSLFLWLGVVAGVCVVGAGLWLLVRGRRDDPLAAPGRGRTAVLTGAALGGLSLTFMYGGLMFYLGGWHWGDGDDDVSTVPFLLDQVFWATPARGAQVWLGYLAGVAVAVGVAYLVAVSTRPLLHRVSPAVRDAGWPIGALLLVVGGAFAAILAGLEWWHWYQLEVVDEPKSGLLLWVHSVWQTTIGLVSPTVTVFVLVVVGAVLLLQYARRRQATPAGHDPR